MEAERPAGSGLSMVVVVLIAIIMIVLVVFIIVWVSRRHRTRTPVITTGCTLNSQCATGQVCTNAVCVTPTVPPTPVTPTLPGRPMNVQVVHDSDAGTAVVSWSPVSGATGYSVFRRLNDASVSKNNYDEKKDVGANQTSVNFNGLPTGTHYFSVLATNAYGSGDESAPIVFAPICNVIPSTPSAPFITLDTDQCAAPQNVESVLISFADATGTRPINILKGNGQTGVDAYYTGFSVPTSPQRANLKCTGTMVSYTVTHVSDADQANLIVPSTATNLGTFLDCSWEPVVGAEEYSITLMCVNSAGVEIFVGGQVRAPTTSLRVTTPAGTLLTSAIVYAYKLCDKSPESAPNVHMTPVDP